MNENNMIKEQQKRKLSFDKLTFVMEVKDRFGRETKNITEILEFYEKHFCTEPHDAIFLHRGFVGRFGRNTDTHDQVMDILKDAMIKSLLYKNNRPVNTLDSSSMDALRIERIKDLMRRPSGPGGSVSFWCRRILPGLDFTRLKEAEKLIESICGKIPQNTSMCYQVTSTMRRLMT